jgi:hypothetical protein
MRLEPGDAQGAPHSITAHGANFRNGLFQLRDIPAILGRSDFFAALSNSTMVV